MFDTIFTLLTTFIKSRPLECYNFLSIELYRDVTFLAFPTIGHNERWEYTAVKE